MLCRNDLWIKVLSSLFVGVGCLSCNRFLLFHLIQCCLFDFPRCLSSGLLVVGLLVRLERALVRRLRVLVAASVVGGRGGNTSSCRLDVLRRLNCRPFS